MQHIVKLVNVDSTVGEALDLFVDTICKSWRESGNCKNSVELLGVVLYDGHLLIGKNGGYQHSKDVAD